MRKIISLFCRNYDGDGLVRNEVVPGAEWVLAGEGVATRKWDGMACWVDEGVLYRRYDCRTEVDKRQVPEGRKLANKGVRPPPVGWIPAQDPDPISGSWPGWVPVTNGPEDKWFRQALAKAMLPPENYCVLKDGTYELVGPNIAGRGEQNPEGLTEHVLKPHGDQVLDAPRTFDDLKTWLAERNIEGIVWHHPDGRMVKIKKVDFGLKR